MFYAVFSKLCAEKGVAKSRVLIDLNISKSNGTAWKNGRNKPSNEMLKKLADYFGVTTEYLLTGKENTATPKDDGLSAEFTALYSRLDENHQAAVLSLIKSLLDSQ